MDVLALNNMLDECYKTNKWREGYDRIKEYEDKATDPELLWRMIRSYYQVGKYMPRDKNEAEFLATKGLEISDRALKINGNHFNIRRWSGIHLSWASELAGTKEKIEKSFVIKEHFEKAIALDGSDASVKHLLGRWCYEVASVSWITRNLARAIFAAPPESSYEEALKYFEDSESTSPGWYTGNWLYLAKTHYQLNNKEEAKKWLKKLSEKEAKNPEEREYKSEGEQLQRKL